MKLGLRSRLAMVALVLASLTPATSEAESPSPKATPDSVAFPQTGAPIPIEATDPQLGKRDALLTLVIFADYNPIPYAYFAFDDVIATLRARYSAELRVVVKDLPQPMFKDAALRAAAAHGVYAMGGERAFTKFAAHLGHMPGIADEATLAGFAIASGIADKAAFETGLRNGRWRDEVQKSARFADDELKITSVPVFYLNGLRYDGRQKAESLYAEFDRELAASRAEVGRGITARDVYALRTKKKFGQYLLDSQRASAAADKESLAQSAPKVVGGVSLGRVRLGMSLDALAALPGVRVKRWSGERACVAPRSTSDFCPYLVFTRGGVIERIQYKVSSDGVTIDGKTFPPTASFDEIRNELHCGAVEPAAGGVSVSCPGRVAIVKQNVGCTRFLQDDERSPCGKPFGPGRESYANRRRDSALTRRRHALLRGSSRVGCCVTVRAHAHQ